MHVTAEQNVSVSSMALSIRKSWANKKLHSLRYDMPRSRWAWAQIWSTAKYSNEEKWFSNSKHSEKDFCVPLLICFIAYVQRHCKIWDGGCWAAALTRSNAPSSRSPYPGFPTMFLQSDSSKQSKDSLWTTVPLPVCPSIPIRPVQPATTPFLLFPSPQYACMPW